jgi:hypothetical protein
VVVEKYTLPPDFCPYNNAWVVREEAIGLLRLLVRHGAESRGGESRGESRGESLR